MIRSIALLTICSGLALAGCAGAPPPRIDSTCSTLRPTHASPELKAWLKQRLADPKSPADLAQFTRDVAANNDILRQECTP